MAAAAYAKDLLCHLSPRRIAAKTTRGREDGAIRKWFGGIEHSQQQKLCLDRWQDGTGEGLIKYKEFRNWLDQDDQTLFCPGILGAGKAFAASFVIDYLCQNYQRDLNMNVGIAYVYYNWQKAPDIA